MRILTRCGCLKRILITGVSGFLGAKLAQVLVSEYENVKCLGLYNTYNLILTYSIFQNPMLATRKVDIINKQIEEINNLEDLIILEIERLENLK